MIKLHSTFFLACLSSLSLMTAVFSVDPSDPQTDISSSEETPLVPEKRPIKLDGQTPGLVSSLIPNQSGLAPSLSNYSMPSSNNYPVNSHWLVSISDTEETVELEDGSHWDVSYADRYTLSTWRPYDRVVIAPNYDWFSSKNYYIINKNAKNRIRANLYLNPIEYGEFSHWIVAIDHVAGYVTLENGMVWCVHHKDSYVFREWEVNDHIILGITDNCFASCKHILINANMDSYVRADQY